MGGVSGFVDFNPENDILSLEGKVIFVTGGTAGLGKTSIERLAKHSPAHIYFTGRNVQAGETLARELAGANPPVGATFLEMDFLSLASVKSGCAKFKHGRLDILMCNAGIMSKPPGLSKDGFETHFATNHLAHAMIIRELLPVLRKTAELPDADVRLVCLTSVGWRGHPPGGFTFSTLQTTQERFLGDLFRYGQSKLANIMYPAEVARRYPNIMAVSVHPGVVTTDLLNNLSPVRRSFTYWANMIQGIRFVDEQQGCLNQVWAAAGARRSQLVNGAFYMPIGVLSNEKLDRTAKDVNLAGELWEWTSNVLEKF
ncbi:NAD(P)-binding protein [Xylariomycetidae sp. FL2044]|nr:NAD(P)-binding protein [Xylariomycetidae sp. FL2044]